jgi:DnaK suppressor protein
VTAPRATIDFDRFRTALESERARLLHARQAVHHDGSLLDETGDLAIGSGDHIADSASETYLRELDGGLEENAEHLLVEIEAALGRIEDGSYGLCVACGRPIGEERLEALPYATLCIDDKRALEHS